MNLKQEDSINRETFTIEEGTCEDPDEEISINSWETSFVAPAAEEKKTSTQHFLDNPKEHMKHILAGVKIFEFLEDAFLEKLLKKLKIVKFQRGETVLNQGSVGHELFIVLRGTAEVVQKQDHTDFLEKGKVLRTLKQGDYFGEMGLMNDEAHTASVFVTSGTLTLFSVSKELFQSMKDSNKCLLDSSVRKRAEELVVKAPIFHDFTLEQKQELVQRMKLRRFSAKQVVFHQEDNAQDFFLIIKGQVKVLVRMKNEFSQWLEEVSLLGPGEYFGELGLLANSKAKRRSATVICTCPCIMMSLAQGHFSKIFGETAQGTLVDHSVMRLVGKSQEREYCKKPSISTFDRMFRLAHFCSAQLFSNTAVYMVRSLQKSSYQRLYTRLKEEGIRFLEQVGWASVLAELADSIVDSPEQSTVTTLRQVSHRILAKRPEERSDEDLYVLNALTCENTLRQRLLENLKPHQYLDLCRHMILQQHSPLSTVYAHADVNNGAYMILRGSVRVLVKDSGSIGSLICVEQLKPGDSFGAVDSLARRYETIVTNTNVDLIKLKLSEGEKGLTTVDQRFRHLQALGIFADVDIYILYRLCSFLEDVVVETNCLILEQGEPSDGLYFLTEGSVKVIKQKKGSFPKSGAHDADEGRFAKRFIQSQDSIIFCSLEPVSYFGELSVLSCCKHSLKSMSAIKNEGLVELENVVAAQPSKLLVLKLAHLNLLKKSTVDVIEKEHCAKKALRLNHFQKAKAAHKTHKRYSTPQVISFGKAQMEFIKEKPVSEPEKAPDTSTLHQKALDFIKANTRENLEELMGPVTIADAFPSPESCRKPSINITVKTGLSESFLPEQWPASPSESRRTNSSYGKLECSTVLKTVLSPCSNRRRESSKHSPKGVQNIGFFSDISDTEPASSREGSKSFGGICRSPSSNKRQESSKYSPKGIQNPGFFSDISDTEPASSRERSKSSGGICRSPSSNKRAETSKHSPKAAQAQSFFSDISDSEPVMAKASVGNCRSPLNKRAESSKHSPKAAHAQSFFSDTSDSAESVVDKASGGICRSPSNKRHESAAHFAKLRARAFFNEDSEDSDPRSTGEPQKASGGKCGTPSAKKCRDTHSTSLFSSPVHAFLRHFSGEKVHPGGECSNVQTNSTCTKLEANLSDRPRTPSFNKRGSVAAARTSQKIQTFFGDTPGDQAGLGALDGDKVPPKQKSELYLGQEQSTMPLKCHGKPLQPDASKTTEPQTARMNNYSLPESISIPISMKTPEKQSANNGFSKHTEVQTSRIRTASAREKQESLTASANDPLPKNKRMLRLASPEESSFSEGVFEATVSSPLVADKPVPKVCGSSNSSAQRGQAGQSDRNIGHPCEAKARPKSASPQPNANQFPVVSQRSSNLQSQLCSFTPTLSPKLKSPGSGSKTKKSFFGDDTAELIEVCTVTVVKKELVNDGKHHTIGRTHKEYLHKEEPRSASSSPSTSRSPSVSRQTGHSSHSGFFPKQACSPKNGTSALITARHSSTSNLVYSSERSLFIDIVSRKTPMNATSEASVAFLPETKGQRGHSNRK